MTDQTRRKKRRAEWVNLTDIDQMFHQIWTMFDLQNYKVGDSLNNLITNQRFLWIKSLWS